MQTITGTIRNGQGDPIANAEFVIRSRGRNYKPSPIVLADEADGVGSFSFELPVGDYLFESYGQTLAFRVNLETGTVTIGELLEAK